MQPYIVDSVTMASNWSEFRNLYPSRPFCLLQPKGRIRSDLLIPEAFDNDPLTTFSKVERDFGDASATSDWFEICELNGLRASGVTAVSLFIDISGSMNLTHVNASYLEFLDALDDEGLELKMATFNMDENWIRPHLKNFTTW